MQIVSSKAAGFYVACLLFTLFLCSFGVLDWFIDPAVTCAALINFTFTLYFLVKQRGFFRMNAMLILALLVVIYIWVLAGLTNNIRFHFDILLLTTSYFTIAFCIFNVQLDTGASDKLPGYINLLCTIFIISSVIKLLITGTREEKVLNAGISNFGVFSIILSILSLPLYFSLKKKINLFFLAGLLISLFITVYNKNRIGMFIHAYALCSVIFFYYRNRWQNFSYYILFVLIALVLLLPLAKIDSTSGRLHIWQMLVNNLNQIPLSGFGVNSFKSEFANIQATAMQKISYADYNINDPSFAFNEFLQIYFELGLTGLLLLLGIVIYLVRNNRTAKVFIFEERTIGACALVLLLLFSYPLHDAEMFIPFFLLAVFVCSDYSGYKPVRGWNFSLRIKYAMAAVVVALLVLQTVLLSDIIKWESASLNRTLIQAVSGTQWLGKKVYTQNYVESSLHFNQINDDVPAVIRDIDLLEKYIISSDIKVIKGIYYDRLGNKKEAIANFIYAVHLVPYKIKPKYYLAKIYKESGDRQKCDSLKRVIGRTMPKINNQAFKEFLALTKAL